ncbi:nucleotide-binding oligomerization domain-containing protein 2 isoform X2 [Eucyclogobius newberryi]|uniref:nucleotide-binding oligomerization domain-containing protein 2 isoform X2 n=1 Tax=Eucyclogobius newberryi TaxID=166745 RepID=UPI003B5BE594
MDGTRSAQELVSRRRADIVHALCRSGSGEYLESVLDILLSEEQLTWEDYQNVLVPGRPLHSNARHLLDLVSQKGAEPCVTLMSALEQVLPESTCAESILSVDGERDGASARALVTQRAHLVRELKDSVDGVLDALAASGHFASVECDAVKLPVKTPSQQVRTLLDHVQAKGESAAEVVLHYVKQQQTCSSLLNESQLSFPKELDRYKKKLSSSVLAQSSFVGTYGGGSVMCLDDVYTEGQLELPQDFQGASSVCLTLEDIVGVVGTVNTEADTVLVSGDAGCGKSTLLQRMHQLWARGEALQDFLLLFPFSCRMLNSEQKELSVLDLLFHHCCWPDRDKDEIFQFIIDHPHLIIFTFDGLDELKDTFSDEQRLCCPTRCAPVPIVLFNLLQGCLMKGVRKIVSSRPQAVSPGLKKHLRKEVILKGFSPSGIDSFVRKYHNDTTVAVKVLQSLKTNRALLGLCHSPVLCCIVAQCHKELLDGGEESPKTITYVYLMTMQHFFQRQSSANRTNGLSWLLQHHTTVLHLGQLAFDGINGSIYVFSQAELNKCGITEMDVGSGFLIQSKGMSSNHIKTFEFMHVTIQCFFAATFIILSTNIDHCTIPSLFKAHDTNMEPLGSTCFHACLSSSVQQQQLLNDKDNIEAKHQNIQITAMFLCGLLSQRHQCFWLQCCSSGTIEKRAKQVAKCASKALQKHFKSIPQPVQGEKKSMHAMPGFVWLTKCIYEMQEITVAKDAISKMDVQHIKLTYCNIGPVECTALAFVLQHLKNPVGLQLDNNSVGDVGVEQLLPCLHICQSLYLRNNNISDEGICKVITKGIKCENFQKIALGNNNISAEGAKQLAEGLKRNHSLQFLGLWGNKIGDTGAGALARALENSKSLVWLSLVGNGVGSAGAFALANVIRNCTSLEELWLTDNCITRPGVESLTEALRHNDRVKSVWLINNRLNEKEEEELAQQEHRLIF